MLKLKGYVLNPITVPQPVLNYALRKLSRDAGGEWRYNNYVERKGRWYYIVSKPFIEVLEEPERFCIPNQDHLFYTDEAGEVVVTPVDPDMKFQLDDANIFFQSTADLNNWDLIGDNYASAELYIRDVDYDDDENPSHQMLDIWMRMRSKDNLIESSFRLGLYSGAILLRHVGIYDWRRLEVSDLCYVRQMLNSLIQDDSNIRFAPYYGHRVSADQNPVIYPINGSKGKFTFTRVHDISNIEAINLLHEFSEKGFVDVDLDKSEWESLLANCPPCPVEYNPKAAGNYNAIPQKPWYVRLANYLDI